MVDLDNGDMFLNFMLDKNTRELVVGVDISHFFPAELNSEEREQSVKDG